MNSKLIKNIKLPSWLPYVTAGLGALLYLIQAFIYAHTTPSSLDEGSYLIKGIFYLRGAYEPFEPYGPLTNKAPFAFLIPGFAEYLFGAGLRTGRYFSITLGLLTVIGTWLTARRWAGNWLAAGTVWFFALSPMIIKLHTHAVTEVIIACMLAWICVLVLDKQSHLWKIILASTISAIAVLTRQNMVIILPLFVFYVFWQHGKQKGIWSFVTTAFVFLIIHAYYWPRILIIWTPWLPEALTPFLNSFRLPDESVPIWAPNIDTWNRINSFFQGIRYHFIPIIGSIFGLLFLLPSSKWKNDYSAFRVAVFVGTTYIILLLMHGWASLASQYESYSCVFCFSNYLSFFDPLGILFFVIVFASAWNQNESRALLIFLVCFVVIFSTGIGFSLFEQVGVSLLNLPFPRFSQGRFQSGFTTISDILKYGLNFELLQIKRFISSSLGFTIGVLVLVISFSLWRLNRKTQLAIFLINTYLLIGFILSPILHLGASQIDCQQDIILAHENLGEYLGEIIPPNSLVYWDGGNAFTPMVYIPHARIFPPQINNGYTYHIGGDPDTLYYFSHWNSELDARWRTEADIFIIEAKRYSNWKDFLTPQEFQEFSKPIDSPACTEGAELRIFQRLP